MVFSIRKNIIYFLVALALFFSGSRFLQLGSTSLWLDEAIAYHASNKSLEYAWKMRSLDYNPPLHDMALVFMIKIFGNSEESLRLISAVAGAGTFFILLALIKTHWISCLLAMMLVGFSGIHFLYSQEARPYSCIFLISLGLNLILTSQIQFPKAWSIRKIVLTSILLAINNYLHYCGIIYCVSFLIVLVVYRKKIFLKWTSFLFIAGFQLVAILPWLDTLLLNSQAKPKWLGNIASPLSETLKKLGQSYFFESTLALACSIFMFIAIIYSYFKKTPERYLLLILNTLWLLPTIITIFILTVVSPGQIISRHLFEAYPAFLLSLIFSWTMFFNLNKKNSILLAALFFVFYIPYFFKFGGFEKKIISDEKKLVHYIINRDLKCQDILTNGSPVTLKYYFKRNQYEQLVLRDLAQGSNKIDRSKCPNLFFIVYPMKNRDFSTIQFITKNYKLTEIVSFTGLTMQYWKKIIF